MKFVFAGYSEKGPRQTNDDAWRVAELNSDIIACIADGVGSRHGSAAAAELAIERFVSRALTANPSELSSIAHDINSELMAQTPVGEKGAATTLCACVMRMDAIHGVNIGDSRALLLRGQGLKQLSLDQTEVARLVREGRLDKQAAAIYPRRNVLDEALGVKPSVVVQPFEFQLQSGDRILLTTDGVHAVLTKRELRDISLSSSTPEQLLQKIAEAVTSSGPIDNHSAIAVFII